MINKFNKLLRKDFKKQKKKHTIIMNNIKNFLMSNFLI